MLDRLLDHKADEHFFEEVHAPIFDLCIELLRRNIEKVSQLLGVVEPEKVRKSSRHEHLERDEIALAKLVMKEGEKPGKFLLPHGIILLEFGPYRLFMEGNPEGIQNQRPLGIMELSVDLLMASEQRPTSGKRAGIRWGVYGVVTPSTAWQDAPPSRIIGEGIAPMQARRPTLACHPRMTTVSVSYLVAADMPKNCCSRASVDWPTIAVSLHDTVTVPWLVRCSMCICPGW